MDIKRKIKVRFLDFWDGLDHENHLIMRALRENYEVEIKEDADYVFCSQGGGYEHFDIPPHCVKIFYTGENLFPDFNLVDYAFGFDWMNLGDRYMRLPNYYFSRPQQLRTQLVDTKHILPDGFSIENDKPDFCSFVVSNGNGSPLRKEMFYLLSKYKKVNSGGRFMNNIGAPCKNKIAFTSSHKFSIAFENSSHPGYSTEKITEAFAARTIPIYWGDPEIGRIFNKEAMIFVNDYPSLEAVVERVIALDNDDAAYLEILRKPAWVSEEYRLENYQEEVAAFLKHIIDQPLEQAYRYDRTWYGPIHQNVMRHWRNCSRKSLSAIFREWVRYRFGK